MKNSGAGAESPLAGQMLNLAKEPTIALPQFEALLGLWEQRNPKDHEATAAFGEALLRMHTGKRTNGVNSRRHSRLFRIVPLDTLRNCLMRWLGTVENLLPALPKQEAVPIVRSAFVVCAELNFRPDMMFPLLARRAGKLAGFLDAGSATCIMFSAAKLRFQCCTLFNKMHAAFSNSSRLDRSRNLIRWLWAASVLNPRWTDRYWHWLDHVTLPNSGSRGSVDTILLHHACLHQQTPMKPPKRWRSAVQHELLRRRTLKPKTNRFEAQVQSCLRTKLGLDLKTQVFCEGYWIDAVYKNAARQVAIECQGDVFHCINWDSKRGLNGSSAMKADILAAKGYHVVHIFHSDWEQLKPQDRAEFLRAKLSF